MQTKRREASYYRARKYITKSELDKLIQGRVKGKRESRVRVLKYRATLYLLFFHALRRSELRELRWEAIDLNSNTIHIKRAKGGKDSIHPLVKEEIPDLKLLKQQSNSKYVLPSPDGYMQSLQTTQGFFNRLNAMQIIPIKLHAHMLRHGCGYYLANKGIDTRTIQVYMGHNSIKSTEIYTDICPDRFKSFF